MFRLDETLLLDVYEGRELTFFQDCLLGVVLWRYFSLVPEELSASSTTTTTVILREPRSCCPTVPTHRHATRHVCNDERFAVSALRRSVCRWVHRRGGACSHSCQFLIDVACGRGTQRGKIRHLPLSSPMGSPLSSTAQTNGVSAP